MRIDDISIRKSAVHDRAWVLYVEMTGYKYTGYFDDWGGFLTAITECATYFSVKWGKLKLKDAQRHMTRTVEPS